MSAETLRRAASLMRERAARGIAWESEWDGDYAADKGWLAPPVALAVADLLLGAADLDESIRATGARGFSPDHYAVTIARAYLGEGGDE